LLFMILDDDLLAPNALEIPLRIRRKSFRLSIRYFNHATCILRVMIDIGSYTFALI
jgi:hypothetical protein